MKNKAIKKFLSLLLILIFLIKVHAVYAENTYSISLSGAIVNNANGSNDDPIDVTISTNSNTKNNNQNFILNNQSLEENGETIPNSFMSSPICFTNNSSKTNVTVYVKKITSEKTDKYTTTPWEIISPYEKNIAVGIMSDNKEIYKFDPVKETWENNLIQKEKAIAINELPPSFTREFNIVGKFSEKFTLKDSVKFNVVLEIEENSNESKSEENLADENSNESKNEENLADENLIDENLIE